ncbi:MAG: Rieske 2Fe-2S domain-containing protein, partial [Planctomycetes bacterium]|nr:Rieske 2Fe-2S domain-containing protein [Planctomycetota bacterium]
DELPPGRARAVVFGGRPVLVVRGPAGLVARSAVCTHLGCLVRWEAPRGEFLCPCHGGRFDAAGAVLGGPVHGPLAALPVREENGRILLGG